MSLRIAFRAQEEPIDDDMRRRMTDVANEHTKEMRGMTEKEALQFVNRVIDDAEIVWGVYQDATQPNGVGLHIIKGRRALSTIIESGQFVGKGFAFEMRMSAVPCNGLEQAVATEQVLGDGKSPSVITAQCTCGQPGSISERLSTVAGHRGQRFDQYHRAQSNLSFPLISNTALC